MSSAVTEKVIEKKYAKLKVFAKLTFRYAIYLAILFVLIYGYAMNMGFDAPMEFTRKYWLVLLAISVLGIIVKMAMEKDVRVTVLRKTVEISIGDSDTVYQVADYIGPNIRKSKNINRRHELVFAGGSENGDKDIHIALPGISVRQLKDISDAVYTAKHELSGDYQYTAFEGDVYEKKRCATVDVKFVFLIIGLLLIVALTGMLILGYIFSARIDIGSLAFLLTILVILFIIQLSKFFRYLPVKEAPSKALGSLKFDSSGLTINGRSFLYKEIESVTMTAPYLTGFPKYHRILSVKTYDDKKPVRFSFGRRPANENTEENVQGCTCSYSALYERLKTEKALGRKFRI